MKLGDLISSAPADIADVEIAGVAADSRKVETGFLFAAVKGAAAHGRDFVADAVARGAAAVMSAGDLMGDPGVPHLVVRDVRAELAWAAAAFHPRRPEHLVGVTGTNGKSSTVDFLRQIWTHAGHRAASLGTLGAIWGADAVETRLDLGHTTADPVQLHRTLTMLADEGVTHAAMEVSSHGLEQRRVDALHFHAAAFTNLTQDHLDYHQTMDAYRAAKMRIWSHVRRPGIAVVNADSPEAEAFERGAEGLRIVAAGWRAGSDGLKIREIAPHPASQTLTLKWRSAEARIELPLIGEFQAINAVTAAALAIAMGEEPDLVYAALERLKPVKGRMEHVGATAAGAHVFVDYAHTPDGLNVLLRAARPHAPGRIVLVFGCGGDRDKDKRAKMGAVAAKFADVVIVTDDNPRTEDPAAIRRMIMDAAPGAREIGDRGAAIETGVAMLRAGDALLIAGKGHETGQIFADRTAPFSDQEEALKALKEAA
ncbi:MAG: UDP-N-acetylmuramoyl-L-alanyl-D-glutamate--2,6-diaminopimelate ligase [Alphaproteobacteria bacterium]|nr:UDP-N-acetylmuramoyl-L-alanyl-D-glutamate--2,6-diaminopimelate ligase [Alphaproteobacteria bacterium]